ncbi:MAG: HU family DNA-binding protein [Bacteroidota bacterium]
MNKGELIDKIAADANISKVQVNRMLDSFLKVAAAALVKGEKIKFVGFGTLSPRKRKARNGRNPMTGKVLIIPAHKVAVFRTGEELAKKLNKQKA